MSSTEALSALGVQWFWVAVFLVAALTMFRVGVRRFESYGG